jgi:hypothetical protein
MAFRRNRQEVRQQSMSKDEWVPAFNEKETADTRR